MAEFEELKLVVSLSDNATAGLKALNAELERLGGISQKNTTQLAQATRGVSQMGAASRTAAREMRELEQRFEGLGKGIGQLVLQTGLFTSTPVASALGGMAMSFGGVTTGVLALGAAFIGIDVALAAFSRRMIDLGDKSRGAALLPDQFKNLASQLEHVGYTAEQAEQEVGNFMRTMAEVSRPGTPEFRRMFQQSGGSAIPVINAIQQEIRSGQAGRAITTAVREAQAIFAREMQRPGGDRGEATRQAEAFLSNVGLSLRALDVGDVFDRIAGDPVKWQRRIDASKEFNKEWVKLKDTGEEILASLQEELLPVFKDINSEIAKIGDGWVKGFGAVIKTTIEELKWLWSLLERIDKWLGGKRPDVALANYLLGNEGGNLGPAAAAAYESGSQPGGTPYAPTAAPKGWSGGAPAGAPPGTAAGAPPGTAAEAPAGTATPQGWGGGAGTATPQGWGGGATPGSYTPGGGATPGSYTPGGGATPMSYAPGGGGGGGGGGGAPTGEGAPAAAPGAAPPGVGAPPRADQTGGELGPQAALALARTHLGEHEIRDQGKLQEFFDRNNVKVNPKTTAWCAGFVNANLAAAGVKGTGSLAAGSFTSWGRGVKGDEAVQAGDVGVVRGTSPRTGVEGRHVGMLTGRVDPKTGRVEMIAGNEKDQVATTWRDPSTLHIRRATEKEFLPGSSVPGVAGGSVPGVAGAGPKSAASLAEARAQYAEELKDPAVRDRLMAYTKAEVGNQGPEAQQAFMETTLNRAASRGMSIKQTLSGGYFPAVTHARAAAGLDDATRTQYGPMVDQVMGGSNISGYATGNASGSVGFGGGPQTFKAGGERFGIEQADRSYMDAMMKREINARVEGTGKIQVDVNAPPGTRVDAQGGGLFKEVEMNRQMQMAPAASGPPTDISGDGLNL